MRRFNNLVCLTSLFLIVAPAFCEESKLTIGTWGGAYENAQREILFAPYEKASGSSVETREYYGGLEPLRSNAAPDIVDMLEEEALTACDDGLLVKLNRAQLATSKIESNSNSHQFLNNVISPCAVAHLTFSTLIAFDERAFPGEKPQKIADLFDLERFPGKRALKKEPSAILEWALMAEGVPNSQVYSLLSTERGIRIALKSLSRIRNHIRNTSRYDLGWPDY